MAENARIAHPMALAAGGWLLTGYRLVGIFQAKKEPAMVDAAETLSGGSVVFPVPAILPAQRARMKAAGRGSSSRDLKDMASG
jgi:hypothetical protein